MPEEIIMQVEETPPATPVATAPAPVRPAPAAPQPAPTPAPQEDFDPARLERMMDKYPQAREHLKRILGVNDMANEMALDKACLEAGVAPTTRDEYKEMLIGKDPDDTRARVAKFAKLGVTQPTQAVAAIAGAQPVAPAPAPQYQAPPPLQTAPPKPPDISKMSIDEQMKLLTDTAAKEW